MRYGTYPASETTKSPQCPLTQHQCWEVCRGRRRAPRTKSVPGPTSPLLHDTPKAGTAGTAGQRAPAAVLIYSLSVCSVHPPDWDSSSAGLCGTDQYDLILSILFLTCLLLEKSVADFLICSSLTWLIHPSCPRLSELTAGDSLLHQPWRKST